MDKSLVVFWKQILQFTDFGHKIQKSTFLKKNDFDFNFYQTEVQVVANWFSHLKDPRTFGILRTADALHSF